MAGSDKGVDRGLDQDNTPSREKAISSQKLNDVTGLERPERFTVPDNTINKHAHLLSSMAASILPVQEVHDRVNALMANLPDHIRPHYVPPQVLPVARPALLSMLREADCISPKGNKVEHAAQYEEEVAAFHTPVSIVLEYVIESR